MKSIVITTCIICLIFSQNCFAQTGNVGIGTTTPLARLHVKDSSVLFSASNPPLFPYGPPPIQGYGRRMMWYPAKSAFRAGYVEGPYWDEVNTGLYSTAFGINTRAMGEYTTAFGYTTIALGTGSMSMGAFSLASGTYSTAMGGETKASGDYSTSMGLNSVASGKASTAIGEATKSQGYAGTALGMYNDPVVAVQTAISTTTPLFIIGNGDADDVRSNAMVVLKSGNVGIGTSTPGFSLNFALATGDKISLFGNSGNHYGFGIQSNLLQIHASAVGEDIAFGYGSSSSFSETMRIKGNGNVGIGTTNPMGTLHVSAGNASLALFGPNAVGGQLYVGATIANQTTATTAQVMASDGNLHIDPAAAHNIYIGYYQPRDVFINPNGGNVGIGTTAPSEKLHVAGNVLAIAHTTPSDARFKKNIQPIQDPMEKLMQLNGVTYEYKTNEFPDRGFDDNEQVGVIAQDVEKVFPHLVFTDDKGYKAVDYPKLIPVLIESIKAERMLITTLTTHVKEQQQQIDELKMLVNKLLKN